MSFAKVKGHSDLVRDMNSGAIINNDTSAIESRRKNLKLGSALEDINNMKEEISEIKSLLRELAKNASC